MAVVELGPGGSVDRHLHAFEEGVYVLADAVTLEVAGPAEELAADDYVLHRGRRSRTPSQRPASQPAGSR